MYWRESARLAEQMGWRVVNPSMPGFGGSDPLEWQDVSIENLANQVMAILHKVDAGPVVLLGHSMGGAVAVQFAHDHPRRTLGVIYRDGVSTPAWKERTGIIPTLLSPFLPDVAPMVDMIAAVVFDLPDLAIGRMYSTVRAVLPDMRQNIRTVSQTLPVGSMLMGVDQRSEVRHLVAQQIPILNEWGCFDRITPGHTALEFAAIARSPVLWVPGGHSWMLARPQGQADILTHLARGQEFMAQVETRWRQLTRANTRSAPSTDRSPCDRSAAPTAVGPDRGLPMISRLLQPLLSLHGWQAYALVGLLVFAEDAVMLGFVFPGETAAILGGVLASKGGVSLGGIVAVVVVCAIVGDSVGYAIGDRWGHQLLQLGPLRKRQKGIAGALDQLSRRGALAVFVGRFSAFLRAVIPGLAGMSKLRYRVFLPANAIGGICWGLLYVLLGYFVGERVEKASGIASDILLGLIVVVVVVLFVRHRRKEKREIEGPAETAAPSEDTAG